MNTQLTANVCPDPRRLRAENRICSVSLFEIAGWQLGALGADQDNKQLKVKLPKLQRGFVWEPARIIDLWDSLLRGFPIGSLLLSEIGDQGDARDGNDQYWLLDGQQRATTIAIGFYNPWESHMRGQRR